MYSTRLSQSRMEISRAAASLFWVDGVAATSGDDIAAAAGVSTRTVWRNFRSKESSVEPILAASAYRFLQSLRDWPLESSLEDHLLGGLDADLTTAEVVDEVSAMRIIALTVDEPVLRSAWLMVCSEAEREFAPIVATRLGIDPDDPRARLAAATAAAAARLVNETVSISIVRHGVAPDPRSVVHMLATAIAGSSRESFCDAIVR